MTLLIVIVVLAVLLAAAAKSVGSNQAPVANPNRFSVGVGHTLSLADGILEWSNVYGKGFKLPLASVSAVTVEKTGWGKATVKVIGSGAELAVVTELPEPWAESAQTWITQKLSERSKGTAV